MTAGDITFLGPYNASDSVSIIAGISGAAVVADDIIAWSTANGQQVNFIIVKAA